MKTSQIIIAVTLFAVSPLRAQIVADGATNTLSNVTNTFTGDVTVGTNGSFTLLVLSDNALLTNSVNGIIGRNTTAKSNEVRLISSTSGWRMGGSLFVGSNGASSRLVVSNGALLEDFNGHLGSTDASSNNSALITGAGSVWTNRNSVSIASGFFGGRSNNLVVSGSAALVSGGTASVGGFGNQVLITGAGSRWANQSDFTFGGTGNRLELSDGAGLVSSNATIGSLFSGDTNTVLLTGTGTSWTNSRDLTMGFSSSRAVVTVSNGATLFVGGRTFLGANGGAGLNSISVSDSGTSCTIGSDLYVGSVSSANLLRISSGGFVVSSNAFLGGAIVGASGNSALVVGAGSVWSNRNLLCIGVADRDNQLVVSNGAAVFVGGESVLGQNSGAHSNSVTATGAGTTWSLADYLYVGSNGSFSLLIVSNGALVQSSVCYLGKNSSSSNNLAVVTGTGSQWTMPSLFLGESGRGNRLVVSNHGSLHTVNCYVGTLTASSNNTAEVTGAGASWTAGEITVGHSGRGVNQLVVTNGALVDVSFRTIVGNSPEATNARVIIDGGTLSVTNLAGDAVHVVRHGTTVLNAGLIEVDNCVLTNNPGRLELNGGTLITRGAFIGNGVPFTVGRNGTTPATWDVRAGVTNTFIGGDLIIGSNAPFNQLILTNGALLTNFGTAYLGWDRGGASNRVTLAGAGSQWLLDEGVTVGAFGPANRLVVSNGAALVTGGSSVLGLQFDATNNEAVVTGPGSSWTSGPGQMFVGYNGPDSRLLVSDGGLVASYAGYLGFGLAVGSNNLAVVTGAGSTWSNAFELRVGQISAGNRLVVSNGAVVSANTNIHVGFGSTSTNNRVIVDGGTLRTTNGSATGLLEIRRGTNVLNAGLIEADILRMTNGILSKFELNGGTLSVRSSRLAIGPPLLVGNGVNPATLNLAGNGTHDMSGTLGLIVRSNATLTGNGSLMVQLQVLAGAQLVPGASVGKISLSTPPFFSGTIVMELSKNGSALTNDQIQVTGTVTYGGALIVTNLGPTALAAGDRFPLFSASSYGGSFSVLNLPQPGPGLNWTNKLLLDGSIEVVGVALPQFASITLSDTNVILSGINGPANAPYAVLTATNVALPLSNWLSIATNQFDSSGVFSFTNGIVLSEPERYFRIRTP